MDETDRGILKHLQMVGRLTGADLSERIALPPAPVARRLTRLDQAGVSDGQRATADRSPVPLVSGAYDHLLEDAAQDIQMHEHFPHPSLSRTAVKSPHRSFAMRTVWTGAGLPIE